jgi:hypothetical protein
MQKIKSKEHFVEMQIEDFTTQEEEKVAGPKKSYDVRHTILDEVEKFVGDKEERIEVINAMFKDIDSYKSLGKEAVSKAVEEFVNRRRKEKFAEEVPSSTKTDVQETKQSAPVSGSSIQTAQTSDISSKISQLTSDIDALYNNLGLIRNNAHNLNNSGKASTTKSVESFVDGGIIDISKDTSKDVKPDVKSVSPKMESPVEGYEMYARSYATYSPLL